MEKSKFVELVLIAHSNSFGGTERHTIGLLEHIEIKKIPTAFIYCGDGFDQNIKDYQSISKEKTSTKFQNLNFNDLKIWWKSLSNYKTKKMIFVKPSYFSVDVKLLILLKLYCKDIVVIEHSLPPARPPVRRLAGFPILGQWWLKTELKKYFYYKLASRVITVSERAKNELIKHTYYKKIDVCGNGIDMSHWQYNEKKRDDFRLKFDIDKNIYLFGCVGNLFTIKAFHIAIEALAFIKDKTKIKCGLCISGAGPEHENLLKLTKKLNLDNIYFVGKQTDMLSVYSAIDTLLITSISESASLAVLEATACGCYVISSDVGICADVINESKNGFIINSHVSEAWAHEIYLHLERLNKKNTRRVQETKLTAKYDLNNNMSKLILLIRNKIN